MQKRQFTKRQDDPTKRFAWEGESPTEQLSAEMRLRVKQGLPPLPSAPKMIELTQFALTKKLPIVLSSWGMVGPSPEKIYQIESPQQDTGFNAIAWKDQNGSKLYLENLDSLGMVDPESRLKVTLYPQVQGLGIMSAEPKSLMSGWPKPLPNTLFVKSAGTSNEKMAAKKMVLGLLDFCQNSFSLPNKPILKETRTDNLGFGDFAIEFSVKNITQIEPIMTQDVFGQKINLDNLRIAQRSGLRNPQAIYDALKDYQEKLQAGVVNGFRVEEVDPTGGMFKEIETAAKKLKATLDPTITTMEKTQPADAPVLVTLRTLQEQVVSAIDNNFRNELNTRRWQQWLTLNPKQWHMPKPLTEDDIVPGTGTQIGAGLQGPVFKYELDPALGRSPVVLKYDSNGLNEDAKRAGIPEVNPQQSVRAVAASKISEHLNLGIIPRTEVFVGTDDNGRPILGQTMEFVNGAIGQRTAGKKNVTVNQKEVQEYEDKVKNPDKPSRLDLGYAKDMLRRYVKVKGQWYEAESFPADIDYGNPVVQKGLSDLQVFDCIIGHADRNSGNWMYEKDNTGSITGVKGIDNDDTFGEKWLPLNPQPKYFSDMGSKTPGIPPIVDISTALSILKADFNKDIQPLLAGLSDGEIDKAAERFKQVQQAVVQRVMAGNIASIDPIGVQAKLEELRELPNMEAQPGVLIWGASRIADTHTEQNSYLGYIIAEKTRLAQQYPGSEGVVPESGLV